MTTRPLDARLDQGATDGLHAALDKLSVLLLMGGTFCCSMDWQIPTPVGSLPYAHAFFLATLMCQAPWAAQGFARQGGISLLALAGSLLIVLSGMISVARGDAHADPGNTMRLFFALLILPLSLQLAFKDDWRRVDLVLGAWLAGATASALVAVASRYNIALFGFFDPESASGGRARGLSFVTNELGYIGALTAPVATYFVFRCGSSTGRILALGALALVISGIHLSGSRGSTLALAAGLGAAMLGRMRPRYLPITLLLTLAVVAASVLGYTVAKELDLPISARMEESALGRTLGLSPWTEHSDTGRRALLQFAWNGFLESPYFGQGWAYLHLAHFHLAAILHSGGLLGTAAFLTWLTGVILCCVRVGFAVKAGNDPVARKLWLTSVVILVVWFVNGAVQPLTWDANGYIEVGVLFALDAIYRRDRWRGQFVAHERPPPFDQPADRNGTAGRSHY